MIALIVGPMPDYLMISRFFGEEIDRRLFYSLPGVEFTAENKIVHLPTLEDLDSFLTAQEESPKPLYLVVAELEVPRDGTLPGRIRAFLREQFALPGVYSTATDNGVRAKMRAPWLIEED